MKKYLQLIVVLFVTIAIVERLPHPEPKKIPMSIPVPPPPPTSVKVFMEKIAKIESGGNYKVVNEYGMMGKYQFNPKTVKALGFDVTREEFLNNPQLQDQVMMAYIRANHQDLKPVIDRYNGKYVKGIKITRASILAGAHFAGSGGVVRYLNSDDQVGTVDARGTTLKKYMELFSNFNLPAV